MRLTPTITAWKFWQSTATVQILQGPRREGKTHTCITKPLYVSQHRKPPGAEWPLKVGVIRDTWTNLERSVIANLMELQVKGLQVEFKENRTQALLGGGLVHMFLIGIDRPAEISKLQGFGCACVYIEEPAPAMDISGGIPPEVLGVGITSLSQPGWEHWVQIAMNPPDEDHWILKLPEVLRELAVTLKFDPATFTIAQFNIPPGERVSKEERERNRIGLELIGRGDLVERLVFGRPGMVVRGEKVFPEFGMDLHVSKHPLPILKGRKVIRGWDFGLNPTCLFSQISPLGHWNILGVRVGENIGLEQLIATAVKPFQAMYFPIEEEWEFEDYIDPAGAAKDALNSEQSCVTVLVELLDAHPILGPIPWTDRRDALRAVLNRSIRGRGMVQIDPDEGKPLIRALRGGLAYPRNSIGKIEESIEAAKRNSGIHSHPVDAATYIAGALWPASEAARRRATKAKGEKLKVPKALSWMTA